MRLRARDGKAATPSAGFVNVAVWLQVKVTGERTGQVHVGFKAGASVAPTFITELQ